MKKTGLMRFVAFVLSVIMVTETPLNVLANEAIADTAYMSETEDMLSASSEEEIITDDVSKSDAEAEESYIEDTISKALAEENRQESFEAIEESSVNDIEETGEETAQDRIGLHLTKELTDERTENSVTFERSDHSITTYIYSDPVSYLTEDNEWRLIDNRLYLEEIDESPDHKESVTVDEHTNKDIIEKEENKESNADDFGGYVNTDASYRVKFAEEADENRIMKISDGTYGIVLAYVPQERVGNLGISSAKTSSDNTRKDDSEVTNESSDKDKIIAEKNDVENVDKGNTQVSVDNGDEEKNIEQQMMTGEENSSEAESAYEDDSSEISAVGENGKTSKSKTDSVKSDSDSENEIIAGKTEVSEDVGKTASTKWVRKISILDPDKNATESNVYDNDVNLLGSSEKDVLEEEYETVTEESKSDIQSQQEEICPDLPRPQTVLYSEIEQGVDLRYELLSDGVKETIVLQNADVPNSYEFKLNIGNLTARKTESGGIYLCNLSDQPLFEIPAPVITDAAGNDDCLASYEMKSSSDNIISLTVTIDQNWLKDSNREFPIEIDPTIKRYRRYKSLSNLGDFVSVCSDGTKDTEKLQVGKTSKKDEKTGKSKPVTYRTFMRPKLPDIDTGSVVTEAKLRLSAGESSQIFYCSPIPDPDREKDAWTVDGIKISNLPVNKKSLKNISDFGKNNTVVLDITKDVKEIKAGRKSANGWCFISADENVKAVRTIAPYKGTDKPFLEITYKDFTGTEDYYSAHTQSVGSAGTGSINDYTGRLTFAHTDATSAGNRMPLSISHVYDIAYGECIGEEKWLAGADYISPYGRHFRLSTDVRLLIPIGETDVKDYPYVYIDADGTKHYFKKAEVTYFVNGSSKTASKSNAEYPAAKDEDGLGLFVVPVSSDNLKGTYPLKIVNKSGSTSMYFDKNGYLRMITDSNQKENMGNSDKKERNAITIDYDPGKSGSSSEHARLEKIENTIRNYYTKELTQEEMIDQASSYITDLEHFEGESMNVSVRYKIALNLQKAKDSLQKIPDGDKKSNYKDDFKAAADYIKKALGEPFDATTYIPVKITDGAGISAELKYDHDGRLISMTDPYEGYDEITYQYDKSGNLVRIDHPNSTYAVFSYDSEGHLIKAVDERGYRMDYVYGGDKKSPTDQVVKYTEYVDKKAGQTVLVNYDEFNATAYTYSGLNEYTGDNDDIENVICFDNKGRTTSTYSRKKKTKEVIGATVKSYTDDDTDSTSSANKIKEAASTGSQVINLLTDSGFEKETAKNGTPAWETFNTGEAKKDTVKRSTSQKYMGSKSGYVEFKSDAAGKEAGFRQTITVPETGTYTASVYIHTKGLSDDAQARIKVSTKNKSAESGERNDSEEESGEESDEGADPSDDEEYTDEGEDVGYDEGSETSEEGFVDADSQPDINNGWKRIEITISAKKGQDVTITLSLSGKSGEAWFDCAQIEKGKLANQYNMLPNGGFEAGFKENVSLPDLPSGWAYGAEAVKDTESATDDDAEFPDDNEEAEEEESQDDADAAAVGIVDAGSVGDTIIEGKSVLRITGNPIKRRSVVINPNFGSEKASYTFSCYVKADCAPLTGKRKCGVYVRGDKASYNEDNASGKYVSISGSSAASTKINTQTDEWQFITVALPVKNWKGKLIEIRFDYEVGNLYIDGCMLTKNEVKTKTYTSGGKLKTEQKGERTTTYATDGRDRRKKETTAGGATTAYTYDSVTNDLKTEKHTFKQSGNSRTLTTKYEYDKYGNIEKTTESATSVSKKIVTDTEYDDLGRFAIKDTDSRGYDSTTFYDENSGQILSTLDARDVETTYTYDQYHQPTGISSAGNSVKYTYNSKKYDRLTSIQTGEGKASEKYTFKYDAYGNTTAVTRQANNKKLISYEYMPNNGKLKSETYGNWAIDIKGISNKNKVTYGYNDLEQLVSESWGINDVTRYEYDNRGNKARITDSRSALKYRYYYDERGRVTNAEISKMGEKNDSELISFQSIYDKAGRQSVFAYYTGGRAYRTEYGYTSDDKVSAASLPSGGVFNRTYDGFDRVTKDVYTPHKKKATGEDTPRKDGAPVTSKYTYLDTDRNQEDGSTTKGENTTYKFTTRLLSKLETKVGTGKKEQTAVSETLAYDELGRINEWTSEKSAISPEIGVDKTSAILYKYDDLGRLVSAEDSGKKRKWEYSYDAIGNITKSVFTEGEGTKQTETYKYDRDNLTNYNGQKVSGYKGGNPKSYLGNTLTWSHGRQLMSVKPSAKKRLADGSPAQTATYTYAYDGSRLSKTVGKTSKSDGIKTEYILNGSLILVQNTTYPDGSKETLNFYYSSDGKLLEMGYLKSGTDGIIPKDAVETHYSIIRNAMGDIAALYTADGTLVGTYEYDPYGLPLKIDANKELKDSEVILKKNPFRYRGYYYDQETGWYYLQSRYYDPLVKRFINADSTDLLTTDNNNIMQYNMFMYCVGDPVNNTDPNGCDPMDDAQAWAAIAIVLFVCAVIAASIPTGGAGGAALAVAGGGVIESGAAISATAVGEACLTGSAVAIGTSGLLAASSYNNSSNNKEQLKKCNKNDLQKYVEEQGYEKVEDFKENYVGKENVSKFNVKYDPSTKQMYLESIRGGYQIPLEGEIWH